MCGAKKKAQQAIAAANQATAAAVADATALRERLAAPVQVASYDSMEANQQADIEARLRRRRAGAAANVLTSPTGIPATPTLGGVAA